jgi:histidine ammonia-lyase
LKIDGNSLTLSDVWDVCRNFRRVQISEKADERVAKSRKFVETVLKENRVVYGITTGVGDLVKTVISPQESETLQKNLLRSHAVGVGNPLPEDVVRGMILLRANALAKGYSGVRKELITFLMELLNRRICPFIPSQGSVGASGDLAPLAHLALVIIGEGECLKNGKRVPSIKILREKGLKPLRLLAKEGLALINGTQVMASIGCLTASEADLLMKNAQIAGALSLEALKGTARAFDPKIHELRPYRGQIRCAKNMRRLVEGSAIIASHRNCEKVQDAYSLRCIPQVYGAILDTVEYAKSILSIEINSATDNPLVFADEKEVISAGNFHGEPLAFAMDFLGIALSEIGSVSERTVDRLVNPHVSGLPPFLAKKSGLNSGFMIAQYTAASLVSENKVLAFPSSVDSIPTSAGQEDHVSMGTISARNAWKILQNVENVLAIEMICSAQGIEFHAHSPGKGTRVAYRTIRKHIKSLEDDRVLYKDIEKAKELIVSGEIVGKVEEAIGPLE